MNNLVLTLNAGSSSLKFALFGRAAAGPLLLAHGLAEMTGTACRIAVHDADGREQAREDWRDGDFHEAALARVLAWRTATYPAASIAAVGHRVVHGGIRYDAPVVLDGAILAELEALVSLAPLHQPHNLAGIRAARAAWPGVPQVACFDTAFHRNHPFVNDAFALPRHFYAEGIRRYGFHGLSYEYVTARLRTLAPDRADGRVIVAHLGNGASICAIRNGRSVASSMGFTALDGLPMGTRCGQLDPGVVLHLIGQLGMTANEVSDLLYKESGLKGLSGLSHDMRTLLAAGTPEARDAIDYFVHRLRREIGGLMTVLEGIETLVFCGGIGENAAEIRAATLAGMAWLGIELDAAANITGAAERVISTSDSRVQVRIIPTDEEAMIARHTMEAIRA